MSTPEITLPRHRLTVEQYDRMAEIGILAPDTHVELIEGEIIDMSPQGSRHADVITELNHRLVFAVGESGRVRCQLPIRLGKHSEPEPDFAIVRPRGTHYATAHPEAEDVLLVIEISNTTVSYDRFIKIPLYARFGIPEAWLIDLQAQRLHVFRAPLDNDYAEVSIFDRRGVVHPVSLPDVRIDLTAIL